MKLLCFGLALLMGMQLVAATQEPAVVVPNLVPPESLPTPEVPVATAAPNEEVQPVLEEAAKISAPETSAAEAPVVQPISTVAPAPMIPNPEQQAPVAAETPAPANVAPLGKEYGIETIDVESGGNWLIKRVIWEDGQRLYEKINSLLKDILESRISFFEVRAAADRSLITFFVQSGFAQGELQEALEELISTVEHDRSQHQGNISESERAIQTSAEEKKKTLVQLQTDVKSIGDFDTALDNALTEMMRQINRSMDYERQGWQRFKEIGQEIDDRKARISYAHMEAAFKNLQAINAYLNGPFANYFTDASQRLASLTDTVSTQVADLKKDGVLLKNKLTDVELAEQQAAQEKAEKEKKEKAEAEKKAAEAKKKTWYSSFSFIWEYPAALVSNTWNWITSLFGSKPTIKATK